MCCSVSVRPCTRVTIQVLCWRESGLVRNGTEEGDPRNPDGCGDENPQSLFQVLDGRSGLTVHEGRRRRLRVHGPGDLLVALDTPVVNMKVAGVRRRNVALHPQGGLVGRQTTLPSSSEVSKDSVPDTPNVPRVPGNLSPGNHGSLNSLDTRTVHSGSLDLGNPSTTSGAGNQTRSSYDRTSTDTSTTSHSLPSPTPFPTPHHLRPPPDRDHSVLRSVCKVGQLRTPCLESPLLNPKEHSRSVGD